MARIIGVDIPNDKQLHVALTYIYGIGPSRSAEILKKTALEPTARVKDLSEEEMSRIAAVIQNDYAVEGDLRRDVQQNIKRLMDIGCYRGSRHIRGLPARGQRTKTNARTRKGPRRSIAGKKKPPAKG
jgi:small subunit ribosomal protein S13